MTTDAESITRRADGRFDVLCQGGKKETVTAEQLRAGSVCVPDAKNRFDAQCTGPQLSPSFVAQTIGAGSTGSVTYPVEAYFRYAMCTELAGCKPWTELAVPHGANELALAGGEWLEAPRSGSMYVTHGGGPFGTSVYDTYERQPGSNHYRLPSELRLEYSGGSNARFALGTMTTWASSAHHFTPSGSWSGELPGKTEDYTNASTPPSSPAAMFVGKAAPLLVAKRYVENIASSCFEFRVSYAEASSSWPFALAKVPTLKAELVVRGDYASPKVQANP